jgi:hypothetical protein
MALQVFEVSWRSGLTGLLPFPCTSNTSGLASSPVRWTVLRHSLGHHAHKKLSTAELSQASSARLALNWLLRAGPFTTCEATA